MDIISTSQIAVFLTELGAAAVVAVAALAHVSRGTRIRFIMSAVLIAAVSPFAATWLFAQYYERLIYKENFNTSSAFVDVVESKAGVVSVNSEGGVFGGGICDGRLSVDLIVHTNFIIRPFSLPLFHPKPRTVFLIGLSTGAWAQVLINNPEIDRLTIVEINPGYLPIIEKHPVVRGVL